MKKIKQLYRKIANFIAIRVFGVKYLPASQVFSPEEIRKQKIYCISELLRNNKFSKIIESLRNDGAVLYSEANNIVDELRYTAPTHVTVEDMEAFYDDLAKDYARLVYTFRNVIDVQIVDPIDEEDNPDRVRVYNLVLKDDTATGLCMEIAKTHGDLETITYGYENFFKFFFNRSIFDVKKNMVNATYMHFAWKVLEYVTKNAKGWADERLSESEWWAIAVNVAANEIARNSYRGAGNVLIIDTQTADRLLTNHYLGTSNSPNFIKVKVESDSTQFPEEFEWLECLEYRFTLNETIRVFSSSFLNGLLKDEDYNALLLYNGLQSDSYATLSVGELAGWQLDKMTVVEKDSSTDSDYNAVSYEDTKTIYTPAVRERMAVTGLNENENSKYAQRNRMLKLKLNFGLGDEHKNDETAL